jgi:hypothetical protein
MGLILCVGDGYCHDAAQRGMVRCAARHSALRFSQFVAELKYFRKT